jgi:4-hydroxy-tetrahydrodipicolinate reductase
MTDSVRALRLALIGYGKMGKEVERVAVDRGMQITARVDVDTPSLSIEGVQQADVAVHFALPPTVVKHVEELAVLRKSIVIGTTGWQNDHERIQSLVQSSGIGLVHASNFSLGVNVFYRILKEAGTLFDRFNDYDVSIHEIHHKDKVDAPSGTAVSIANILLSAIKRKKVILTGSPEGKIRPDQLHVTSGRIGAVVGTHKVQFDSTADSIELVHTAKDRSGFALGAIVAAEWIKDKQGMYTFDEVLEDVFNQKR